MDRYSSVPREARQDHNSSPTMSSFRTKPTSSVYKWHHHFMCHTWQSREIFPLKFLERLTDRKGDLILLMLDSATPENLLTQLVTTLTFENSHTGQRITEGSVENPRRIKTRKAKDSRISWTLTWKLYQWFLNQDFWTVTGKGKFFSIDRIHSVWLDF